MNEYRAKLGNISNEHSNIKRCTMFGRGRHKMQIQNGRCTNHDCNNDIICVMRCKTTICLKYPDKALQNHNFFTYGKHKSNIFSKTNHGP